MQADRLRRRLEGGEEATAEGGNEKHAGIFAYQRCRVKANLPLHDIYRHFQ
jgi:hypothetical protein